MKIIRQVDLSIKIKYNISEVISVYNVEQILLKDGLSFSILSELSYQSHLNVNLKRDLRYFDKESLFAELFAVAE